LADPAVPEPLKPVAASPVPAPPRFVSEYPSYQVNRRGFLSWLAVGWAAFGASAAAAGGAFNRFLMPNLPLYNPPLVRKCGWPDAFEKDRVDERQKPNGFWLRRGFDKATGRTGIYALSTTCTHLGCTPNYLSAEQKFKCPCHGSGFYETGINFEGPAPRPLERYRILLADDGQVMVDKGRKFQQEKGEWMDGEAFLAI